jgi:hypothetical protein
MEEPQIFGHDYRAPGVCAFLVETSLLKTNKLAEVPVVYLRNGSLTQVMNF